MAAHRNEKMLSIAVCGLLVIALVWGSASCAKGAPSSKHPDQILYERAMSALEHDRFDVARMTLKTLINTYPDSEWAEQAKLRLKDQKLSKCLFGVGPADDDCDATETNTPVQNLIAAAPISRCPDPRLRQAEIGGDRITGVVLRQGKPVNGARVKVYSSSSSGKTEWVGGTDKAGSFTSKHLAPGSYLLELNDWGKTMAATVKLNGAKVPGTPGYFVTLTTDDGCISWGFQLD